MCHLGKGIHDGESGSATSLVGRGDARGGMTAPSARTKPSSADASALSPAFFPDEHPRLESGNSASQVLIGAE